MFRVIPCLYAYSLLPSISPCFDKKKKSKAIAHLPLVLECFPCHQWTSDVKTLLITHFTLILFMGDFWGPNNCFLHGFFLWSRLNVPNHLVYHFAQQNEVWWQSAIFEISLKWVEQGAHILYVPTIIIRYKYVFLENKIKIFSNTHCLAHIPISKRS